MDRLKRMKDSIMEKVFAWQSWRLVKNEKGQGLIEYALILVLIAVVVIAILTGLGAKASSVFNNINSRI